MPLLRERATAAVDAAAARRIAKALQGIRGVGAAPAGTAAAAGDAAAGTAPGTVPAGRSTASAATASVSVDGHAIVVPADVRDAVLDLLQRFADGQSVVVGSTDSLLTTSQAAELLGISATYLLRLANEGTLPVEFRGTHRRFRLADVMLYLESTRAAKAAKAAAATPAAAAADTPSDPPPAPSTP